MNILEIENLSCIRNETKILDSINLSIARGSLVGLTGPNGGGKSTLFEFIMGWHRVRHGSIRFQNHIVKTLLSQSSIRPQALPLSVQSFIEMGTWSKFSGTPALTIGDALEKLELTSLANRSISDLSGGEWKKACLARCLVQPADLYLLDEPFNHLDVRSEDRIGHIFRELAEKKEKTFFIVSHDWHAMNHFFDRVILMNRKILADGPVADVNKVYLNWLDPKHHEWIHSA